MTEFPLYNTTLKNPVRKIREFFNLSLSLKMDFGEQSVSLYRARRTQPARNHDRGEESIQTSDELARNSARAVLFHISSFKIVATKNFKVVLEHLEARKNHLFFQISSLQLSITMALEESN